MPKRPTAKQGFPRQPEECYPIRHMTPREFTVYDVMVAFSTAARIGREGRNGTGKLIFNASVEPTLANAVNCSADTVAETIQRLVDKGWLLLSKEGERKPDGTQAPNWYEVVTHEGFVSSHPGTCPPNTYCPNFETAQAHGIKIGDKLGDKKALPENFQDSVLSARLLRYEDEHPELAEEGYFLSDAVPENSAKTKKPFRRTPPAVPKNSASRTGELRPTVPEFSGRSLVPTVSEIQTTTTPPENTEPRGGGGFLQTLATMWLRKHGTRPEPTKANRKEIAKLEEIHGAKRVEQIFVVYLEQPSPYKTETTFPFTRFITGFDGYAAIVDEKPKRDKEAAEEAEKLKAAFKAQDAEYRKKHQTRTPEQREADRKESERLRDKI